MLFLHEVKLDYTDLLRVEMEIIEYLFLKNLIGTYKSVPDIF